MKKNYMSNPSYNYEIVNRASLACGPMVKWAIAQVGPKPALQVGGLRLLSFGFHLLSVAAMAIFWFFAYCLSSKFKDIFFPFFKTGFPVWHPYVSPPKCWD